MTNYLIFSIGNLTSEFGLGFLQTCIFLNKESHKSFISYFVFP